MSVPAVYAEPSKPKADGWAEVFAQGCGGRVIRNGVRDRHASDHAVMGNWPVTIRLIADFAKDGTRYWYLDSGYIQGTGRRDLRIERNGFWPRPSVDSHTMDRALSMGVEIKPWRRDGRYVLICLHSEKFGRPWGIDPVSWNETIEGRVRARTNRPIIVRRKPVNPAQMRAAEPLDEQLENAWCVVCHSSTIGVRAALAGVPVFCEPTCAAAAVGRTDLSIDDPVYPDREQWIADLAWRQWSRAEIASGEAWAHIKDRR